MTDRKYLKMLDYNLSPALTGLFPCICCVVMYDGQFCWTPNVYVVYSGKVFDLVMDLIAIVDV